MTEGKQGPNPNPENNLNNGNPRSPFGASWLCKQNIQLHP